jgi:hypothetical protein
MIKVTEICGKTINLMQMISNKNLLSEIPTMKPLD